MSKKLDIDIFKLILPDMSSSEIYLGSILFEFHYSIAEFTATCTEAIPFNPIDKVICGLLTVEDSLSFNDIGDILGLNVYAANTPKKYLDMAEKEILTEALQSLASEEYGKMIEGGDIYFSKCSLTSIGKDYASKKNKFRTTTNKPFTIYFDHTTGNNISAKENFEFAEGEDSEEEFTIVFGEDENSKAIVRKQIPEIYNPEKQHSYTDAVLQSQQNFLVEYPIGIIFNVESNKFRFVCYKVSEKKLHAEFTDWLNKEESAQKGLLQRYVSNRSFNLESENVLTRNLNQLANEINNKKLIDEYLLYTKLSEFIPSKEKVELIVSLPFVSESILQELSSISMKSENSESIFYFIFPNELDSEMQDRVDELESFSFEIDNLFVMQMDSAPLNIICRKESKSFTITLVDVCIEETQSVFTKTFANKKHLTENTNEYERNFLNLFAGKYVNTLCEEANTFINDLQINSVTRKDIERLAFFEFKLKPFSNIESHSSTIQLMFAVIAKARMNWTENLKSRIENEIQNIEQSLHTVADEMRFLELKNSFANTELKICFSDSEIEVMIQRVKKIIADKTHAFEEAKKIFSLILDTNIFLKDQDIISKIEPKNKIIVAEKVLNELTEFRNNSQTREIAKHCINEIQANKNRNVHRPKTNMKLLPKNFPKRNLENQMLAVAEMYKRSNGILVSDVESLREKAMKLNLTVMSSEELISKFVNSKK